MRDQFVFNAIVVVIGWGIVHVLSVRRDRDKARREMVAKSVESLNASLNDLMSIARTYHCGEREMSAEQQIKMTIQDAAQSLSGLRLIAADASYVVRCQSAIRGVRSAITGKHFEDEHTARLSLDDPLLQAIAEEIMRAKRALTDLKHAQFLG